MLPIVTASLDELTEEHDKAFEEHRKAANECRKALEAKELNDYLAYFKKDRQDTITLIKTAVLHSHTNPRLVLKSSRVYSLNFLKVLTPELHLW